MDPFPRKADETYGPFKNAVAVTPHNVDELPVIPTSIYIGTGGTLIARAMDSSADVTYKNLPSGSELQGRFRYIRATGTTCADIIAQW